MHLIPIRSSRLPLFVLPFTPGLFQPFIYWFIQDQTVKIAEAGDLEDELQRVKVENAELQKRVSELANIDAAKKKAESRAEQLEEKARLIGHVLNAG
jgi:hypothetical protein